MMEFRTYDVTLANKSIMSFHEAHDVKEEHGILTIIGKDGGLLAIFYRDTWSAVVWRDAKTEHHFEDVEKPAELPQ